MVGLSYTQFRYEPPRLSAVRLGPSDSLQVHVRVQNVGERAGTEVVQLYLRDDVGSTTRPVQALRGFSRIRLEPGATRDVTFTLDQEDFALLDPSLERVVEAGTFTVMTGGSSSAVQSASFEITRPAKLKGSGSYIPRELRESPAR